MLKRIVILVLVLSVGVPPAASSCLELRTFRPEERQRFETRHGLEWWKTLGLIPGPAQAGDWVERPWGDSFRTFHMPQQFWDPRACAAGVPTAEEARGRLNPPHNK